MMQGDLVPRLAEQAVGSAGVVIQDVPRTPAHAWDDSPHVQTH
jgi:hypothetical protein